MKTKISLIALLCIWLYVQNEDYNEMQEQEVRAKFVKQEKAERVKKNEAYNKLAQEGKRLTGFDGEIK